MKHNFILLSAALTIFIAACSSTPTVMPTPTFDAQKTQGQSIFNLRCAQCHATVPDTIIIGPSLAGIATRAGTRVEGYDSQEYIETSILNPSQHVVEGFPDTMPKNFGKDLTSEELNAVVSFLMTLK